MKSPDVRAYTLTLDGTAQRLSSVLEDDDVPLAWVSFQAGPSNSNAVFIGGPDVSTSLWFWRIPVPATSVPDRPLIIQNQERLRLGQLWAIGTNGETLHIGVHA